MGIGRGVVRTVVGGYMHPDRKSGGTHGHRPGYP